MNSHWVLASMLNIFEELTASEVNRHSVSLRLFELGCDKNPRRMSLLGLVLFIAKHSRIGNEN